MKMDYKKKIKHLVDMINKLKYDSLTGFYTRVYFDNFLYEKLERKLEKNGGTVVFYDLNRLKEINNKYGYEFGDLYIKMCAYAIKTRGGKGVYIRLGGDEFLSIHTEKVDVKSCLAYTAFYKHIPPMNNPFNTKTLNLRNVIRMLGEKVLNEKPKTPTFKDVVEILNEFDFNIVPREDIDDENVYGVTIYPTDDMRGEILVIKELNDEERKKTIIHELLHAYSFIKGYDWDEKKVEEETEKIYKQLYKIPQR